MFIVSGWLQGQSVKHLKSINCDARPDAEDLSLLVVHGISLPPGQFGNGYVEQFFTNCLETSIHPYFDIIQNLRVSAHCFIDRSGLIVQFVAFHDRAWHAGVSSYQGRVDCNDFSIGIELEGIDTVAYTAEQYNSLAALVQLLQKHYPATQGNLVGHSDIAPGRKTDPGPAFDWNLLTEILNA